MPKLISIAWYLLGIEGFQPVVNNINDIWALLKVHVIGSICWLIRIILLA